jgi:hypothetical protein
MSAACLVLCGILGAPAFDAPEERRAFVERIDRVLAALEAARRDLPRDAFDIQGVLETAGRDPVKLHEWVRDRTVWLPYAGTLRGATGVLLDRSGNSLDRSLLLADLLQAAGHRARLARAPLAEDQARALVEKLRAAAVAAPGTRDPPGPPPPASAEDIASARLTEEAVQRVAAATAALRSAVTLPPADPAASLREDAEALRDHWWVEVESKGAWMPLDPLIPGAAPGTSLVPAAGTIERSGGSGSFPLPAAMRHEVEIRIVVERLQGGKRSERLVLGQVLRPAEVIGRRVKLFHHPLRWPENLQVGKDKASEERLTKALIAQKEWLPILEVGRSRISRGSFTDTGDVNETPNLDPAAQLARGAGGALGGALGAFGGGGDAGLRAVLTAEWLDLEIRSPGRPPRKVRREVFDILGPAARTSSSPSLEVVEALRLDRALILFGETEILIGASKLSPELVAHQEATELLERRAAFKALAGVDDAARWKEIAGQLAWESTRPQPLEAFALLRGGLGRHASEVFLDRPNVVTHAKRYRWDAKAGLTAEHVVDVAANGVAVRGGGATAPALARLEQGVADTVAEDLALGWAIEDSENTAAIFALADAAGVPAVVLAGPDASLDSLALPPDVRERVRSDLASNHTVVIPRGPVLLRGAPRTGWWRVEPATGETIGVMDTGFNTATSEYSENTVITTRAQALRRQLDWFQRQWAGRFYRGNPRNLGAHWRDIQEVERLQAAARAILAQMDYLAIGL